MEYCERCWSIVYYLFNKPDYQLSNDFVDSRVRRFLLTDNYHPGQSLSAVACKLCTFIQQGLPSGDEAKEKFAVWPAGNMTLIMQTRGGNAFRRASRHEGLQLWDMQVIVAHENQQTKHLMLVSVTAAKGSPAAIVGDVFGTNQLTNSPTSDALSILRSRFEECASSHEKCIAGTLDAGKSELPTRILNVKTDAGEHTIRLIESKGFRADYAALSHCWGPPEKQPLCTKKATLQEHLTGIPLSKLPKSFRDAIATARAVNLRYLWIDSLCIVQDDAEDWGREAPRMGQLYHDAELVIAATGARDSSQGCFLERLPPEHSIEIPYIRDGISNGHVTLSMKRYSEGMIGPVWEPLGQRAWVYQEWALARRAIHFTTTGTMWTCRETNVKGGDEVVCEDGHIVPGISAKDWYEVIEWYTLRDLTYLSDKLAAVEGIARIMQRDRRDRYVSGVWTDELPQQLFWAGRGTTRPTELQSFPTWSWATTQGPCVSFVPKRVPMDKVTIRCESVVQDSSTLVIHGHSRETVIKRVGLGLFEITREHPFSNLSTLVFLRDAIAHHLLDPDTREIIGLVILDDDRELSDGEHIYTSLLLMQATLVTMTPNDPPVSLALLLRETGTDAQTYRRAGAAWIVETRWFETEKKNYTIN